MRGYFGIGIEYTKCKKNIGTLWRSALLFNASFVFTLGMKYTWRPTDTYKTWRHVPLFQYPSLDELIASMPKDAQLIGIEMTEDAIDLLDFNHPQRCVYLLGTEDTGLSAGTLARCHHIIKLPGVRSMNVSVAGSLVLYDRYLKNEFRTKRMQGYEGHQESTTITK